MIFGDHPEFPNNIYGNDLDLLVKDHELCLQILKERGWVLKREIGGGFRAFQANGEKGLFVLDIVSMTAEPCATKRQIYELAFSTNLNLCLSHSPITFVCKKY